MVLAGPEKRESTHAIEFCAYKHVQLDSGTEHVCRVFPGAQCVVELPIEMMAIKLKIDS